MPARVETAPYPWPHGKAPVTRTPLMTVTVDGHVRYVGPMAKCRLFAERFAGELGR